MRESSERSQIDFKELSAKLLRDSHSFVRGLFPSGTLAGREWKVGNLSGDRGGSLSINLDTGVWKDFATGEKGSDLISLYAGAKGLKQIEAAQEISGSQAALHKDRKKKSKANSPEPQGITLVAPPKGVKVPSFEHKLFGRPSKKWRYKDYEGNVLFFMARYDHDGKKDFIPWSYTTEGKWIKKGWPRPRPLYGLELLKANPDKPILLVEGEKACDAAREFLSGVYVVMTWPSGVGSWRQTRWETIFGRKILIWPDGDKPGLKGGVEIGDYLSEFCTEVKLINVDITLNGWDAADALAEGFTYERWARWAKPLIKVFNISRSIEVPKGLDEVSKPEIKVDSDQDQEGVSNAPLNLDLVSPYVVWTEILGLSLTQTGSPYVNEENAIRCIERWPEFKDLVWYDDFHFRQFTKWRSGEVREWSDQDDLELLIEIQSKLKLHRMSLKSLSSAINAYAYRHRRHEPQDWVKTLSFDGTSRCETFLIDYLGAKDTDYTRAISKNWWVSMVARIFKPGVKCDNMLILEGAQGAFKSTMLEVIGGRWFVDANESIYSKDFYLLLQGKLIVEIAELDSFSRAEANTIKKVVSTATDRFRAPYDRRVQSYPRQCVFVGTTNDNHYLKDPTGGRRFWPVTVGKINIDSISRDRDQLFAEAYQLFLAQNKWWEVPASAAIEQESRRHISMHEDLIRSYVENKDEVAAIDIATEVYKLEPREYNRFDKEIQTILRLLGFINEGVLRAHPSGIRRRYWKRSAPDQSAVISDHNPKNQVITDHENAEKSGTLRVVKNFAPGGKDMTTYN